MCFIHNFSYQDSKKILQKYIHTQINILHSIYQNSMKNRVQYDFEVIYTDLNTECNNFFYHNYKSIYVKRKMFLPVSLFF